MVTKENKVSEDPARVFVGNNVTFYPSDTDQTITIAFQGGKILQLVLTLEDWEPKGNRYWTGRSARRYGYKAWSSPGVAPGDEDAILGVPKLIVDPGPLIPPGDK